MNNAWMFFNISVFHVEKLYRHDKYIFREKSREISTNLLWRKSLISWNYDDDPSRLETDVQFYQEF